MRRKRIPVRLALAVSVVALLGLAGAATAAGYLVEAHRQHTDRNHRLAAAAAYVEQGRAWAETTQWQQALTEKLNALRLSAQIILTGGPARKRPIYPNKALPTVQTDQSNTQPAATYIFPLGGASKGTLALHLFAPPLDRNRRLLIGFASGLAGLLAGLTLLLWAMGRWLAAPLRRLSVQVDAIAGGDPVEARTTSPIREVGNVGTAVAGMATRLAQTAEQDARLEAEHRLLVSSIAHDLRTPLFSLRGYLEAIATGIGDPHERLDRARAKARQIDRLVTNLFDYERADIDRHPQLEATDLAEAVKSATAAFELAASERGVELRLAARTNPQVTIDPDGFDRALANVLDNALRHTPRGGAIDITCGQDTDGAYVHVVDDGPGIPPDLLPRVFEPMARADSSRNGRTGGTGLGLAIAARLLENQAGSIRAANTPERGAILTLRLPHGPA
ncbi:MAG TPA: HAMP domain-containing sensor histidine kinase [Gaiellaceae bacterium]